MFRRQTEITLLQLLLVVEVGIMTTMISFYGIQNSRTEEAGRTLTRQAILSFRSTACKLDQRTRLHIQTLGCAARRRGCRGGQQKVKLKETQCFPIPVVVGTRRQYNPAVSHKKERRRVLTCIKRHQLCSPIADNGHWKIPSVYILNPTSLAKPHAVELLAADVKAYGADVVVITESWLKLRHPDNMFSIPGYNIFRRDRPKRRGGGVVIYIRDDIEASVCKELYTSDTRIELLWIRIIFRNRPIVVGALYHPPKPVYQSCELIDELDRALTNILASCDNSLVLIAGDFNQLSDGLITQLGFYSLFSGATHAGHCLDRIYCSEPVICNSKAVLSTISTSHRAVVVSASHTSDINKKSIICQHRPHTPHHHAAFLAHLAQESWDEVISNSHTQDAFDKFYDKVVLMLDSYYPLHTVTVTNKDPYFVTPKIKSMLRKRNKLMRKSRVAEAESITKRIRDSIATQAKATFSTSKRGGKDLWDKVRQIKGKAKTRSRPMLVTVQQLNQHFATISTDPHYLPPPTKATVNTLAPQSHFTEYSIFRALDKIKPTAGGLDNLPYWFLKIAAPYISMPLSYLFNLSLLQSTVPAQWKISSITPVPKAEQPQTCADYRPISITPILARVMEKQIVRTFLYPVLTHPDSTHLFEDQFAFRPTGSTTATLIYLLHTLTELLQIHDYVHVIALDFSKAFDTVRHFTLVSKLANFTLPDYLHNWIVHNLSDRQHQTKVNGIMSTMLPINASIIQGSAIGPVEYVFTASDLSTFSPSNRLCKYADDTYLLVPAINTQTIPKELQHISDWASANNLKLNNAKSQEIIVHNPRRKRHFIYPSAIPGIKRVSKLNILGVTVSDTLTFHYHLDALIEKTSRSLYAIKTIRAHGLDGNALWDVTRATVVAQLLYASPAWWGFLKADEKSSLQSVVKKAQRCGYLPTPFETLDELRQELDKNLFRSSRYNPHHVLHRLLPQPKDTGYNLRQRAHNLTLPPDANTTTKQNFIFRMLFDDMY